MITCDCTVYYRCKLASAGFSVTIDEYVKELPADVVNRYGLDCEEDVYVLGKSA